MLDALIAAINNKNGMFAAVVVVVGFAYALWKFPADLWKFYTDYKDRNGKRDEKEKAARLSSQGLAIVDQQLSELSLSSNAYELRFIVTNTGTCRLVMRTLRLHVTARGEAPVPRDSYTLAPMKVHRHQVRLGPNDDVYDIRDRKFGRGNEPLYFDPGEGEAFVVKLVSEEIRRYSFYVETAWYGAMDPDKTGTARAASLDAEFPQRVSAGPPPVRSGA